ncbi:MAG: type II toxin-antitoxin system RelE/ParE family toxin [Gammaproteobacteria bacterium]|nr:type II toxin-antitoxin system RelE/ParE family toxin [Gammaproteobacteria bacterium]
MRREYSEQAWGREQAKKYLLGMRETIALLAEFPGQGTVRQDVGEGVLSFPYGSHWLFYRIEKEQLVVFAVLHQRMVPMEHLAER